ncbi:MAG: RAQPRD family integrative conjugative element protein [Gammaproteobacteria bacterium]
MKIKNFLIVAIIISVFSIKSMADDAREKIYLIQMINQLDAIKPLILAAANEQENDARIKFHYKSYRESNGLLHNGLLEDINEIKKGIQDKLNQTTAEPHHFQAIKGDYLDLKNVKSNSLGNVMVVNNAK